MKQKFIFIEYEDEDTFFYYRYKKEIMKRVLVPFRFIPK